VTFTPASVSDNYSVENQKAGLCGVVVPKSFTCHDFSSTEAFLDEDTGKATIELNWEKKLINATLSCKFEYHSTEYDQIWIGDAFDVKISDPCFSTTDYTIHTLPDSTNFRYELGKD